MDHKIQEILIKATFKVQDGRYLYTKVKLFPKNSNYFAVMADKDEITVVSKEENIGELALVEKNKDYWKLIETDPVIPFYVVGYLAAMSNAIAKKGINVLIISTYSKDYLLVVEETIGKTVEALIGLGMRRIV